MEFVINFWLYRKFQTFCFYLVLYGLETPKQFDFRDIFHYLNLVQSNCLGI